MRQPLSAEPSQGADSKKTDLLQILIPTYNRKRYLLKNIDTLDRIIGEQGWGEDVSLVVSDNASSDGTIEALEEYRGVYSVRIAVSENHTNLGLEGNALAILGRATARYVMFLGDDDYLEIGYLCSVIEALRAKDTRLILPSFIAIDMEGKELDWGRNLKKKTRRYPAGCFSSSRLFYLAHQLSGVTFLREGVLEAYRSSCVSNIHLFMFFAGYSALQGASVHITDHPVKVTQPPQDKKDWDYGDDGMVDERFKNSYSLFRGKPLCRLSAEVSLIQYQTVQHLYIYSRKGKAALMTLVSSVYRSRYLSFGGKLIFTGASALYLFFKTAKVLFDRIRSGNG